MVKENYMGSEAGKIRGGISLCRPSAEKPSMRKASGGKASAAGKSPTEKMVMGALFLALGIVMPFLTGQIPGIGSMLLPMHLPVLVCGYVCGWRYGLMVGVVVPILRSMMFGMPPMMPVAVCMAFELGAYGAVTGILYEKLPKTTGSVYASLLGAMVAGRLVWGLAAVVFYSLAGNAFSVQVFLAGAFFNAVPGIILQIVLIPVMIVALKKAKVMD